MSGERNRNDSPIIETKNNYITTRDFSLQAPVYQIINDGRFGDLDFSQNFWRVSASNKEEDMSNVNQMSLALLSRFCHLEIIPESEEFIKYFLEKGVDERIIGYVNNYTEDLFPKRMDESLLINKANPFPRQWEYASNLVKDLDTAKDSNIMHMLVASCIGSETAIRFMAYSKLANKIKIDELIAKPELIKGFERDGQRTSIYYSIISGLAVKWYASDKKLTADKVVEICNILPVEFAVAFLKMIIDKKADSILKAQGGEELFRKIHTITTT